jgi:predicted acylesterase/phospholipase RssA
MTKLTNRRVLTIKQNVQSYITGQKSYTEAKNAAMKEGLAAWVKNLYNRNSSLKVNIIESKFKKILHKTQFKNANTNIDRLAQVAINQDSSHVEFQQIFSNIFFENSIARFTRSEMQHTEDSLTLKLKIFCYDKASKTETPLYREIELTNAEQLKRILAEYVIFQHKQFGAKISQEAYTYNQEIITNYMLNQKKYQYDAICFSGGGAKGTGYPGTLDAIGDDRLSKVKKVSGASAGALTAALVACGIKSFELKEFVGTQNLKLKQFELLSLIKHKLNQTIRARLEEFESTTGHANEQEIAKYKKYFNEERDVTFRDLNTLREIFPDIGFKELFLSSSVVGNNSPIECELSYNKCPDMPISLAAIASAALPLLFTPIEVSQYISEEYKNKLGLADALTIYLNDGGIISNIPYHFLEQENSNILTLTFVDNKDLFKKELSISERIKNALAKHPAYIFRRADIYDLENNHQAPYYINTQSISTTSFELASRKFIALNNSIKNDFIQYEISYNFKPSKLLDKWLLYKRQILKFEIFPTYYSGDFYERSVLARGNPCYFDQLCTETNIEAFNKLLKEVRETIKHEKQNAYFRQKFPLLNKIY